MKITSLPRRRRCLHCTVDRGRFRHRHPCQAPQGPRKVPTPWRRRPATAQLSAPTNLKVLPKDLTGQQVHEIMERSAGSLGVHCDTCHVADASNPMPNGRPHMNFKDNCKPEKQMARMMYAIAEDMKKNYI